MRGNPPDASTDRFWSGIGRWAPLSAYSEFVIGLLLVVLAVVTGLMRLPREHVLTAFGFGIVLLRAGFFTSIGFLLTRRLPRVGPWIVLVFASGAIWGGLKELWHSDIPVRLNIGSPLLTSFLLLVIVIGVLQVVWALRALGRPTPES